ncbi:MAG: 2OG-Fe(II) oxygenase family protein [Glaciecola sp.]
MYKILEQARQLSLPSRDEMLRRDPAVESFWHENETVLAQAWSQWEESEGINLVDLFDDLLAPELKQAVQAAWTDPTKETAVEALLKEVAPNVYACQIFNPERLGQLRAYLEKVWDAQIPLRPPYGIVLNRKGAMLDQRSAGYLAAPSFQAFYRKLIDEYMRPISRLLFPEIVGYDSQSFGFSINYNPKTDTSIRPHTDASAVTLNINLNLPNEEFTGSSVDFFDNNSKQTISLNFEPGSALFHRGNVPHAAQPILTGERTNFVFWLFGDRGTVPLATTRGGHIEAQKRWVLEQPQQDKSAPF